MTSTPASAPQFPFQTHSHRLPRRSGDIQENGPVVDDSAPTKRRKVKTGCLTCKYRRVKCDEGRPWCQRCIKFGVDCDGYSIGTGPPRSHRTILPREQRKTFLLAPRPERRLSFGPQFEDEKEGRCFRIYCEEMATQLKGPFKTALWSQLIPQISEEEPFIRHAIVALGAMRKIAMGPNKGIVGQSHRDSEPDFPYALRQYQRALVGMRKTIADGKKDVQKAMIACILVFCFETMTNKPNNAVVHAESGLMLLQSWMRSNDPENTDYDRGRVWHDQRIEEDLMTAYATLDLQVLFFRDSRPRRIHECVINSTNQGIAEMPSQITSLKAARNYGLLLMRRNYHFIVMVLGEGKAAEMCGPEMHCKAPWEDCVNIFPGGNIFSTPKDPPFALLPDCERYLEDVNRWTKACTTLFENIKRTGTEDEKVLVALSQIHATMLPIMLTGAFFTTQTEYDQYLPEYKTIISLVEWLLPRLTSNADGSIYRYDLGIIVGLFLVGCRCRDFAVRTRACELLQMGGGNKEGFWDCAGASIFILWARDLDEEGRDENGEIPEHKRWFVTSAYVDMEKRKAILGASQRGLRGLNFRQKEFHW